MELWDEEKCKKEMKNEIFCGGLYHQFLINDTYNSFYHAYIHQKSSAAMASKVSTRNCGTERVTRS